MSATTLRLALCVALLVMALVTVAPSGTAKPICVGNGNMDYETFTCVDASDPKCPIYQETANDRDGYQKRCIPSV